MGRLEYDDTGFAFFGIGLGTCFLLPLSLHVAWRLLGAARGDNLTARTRLEREKIVKVEKEKGFRALLTRNFLIETAVVVCGWLFVLYLYSIAETGEIIQFDPWEVLGVEQGSVDDRIIQKKIKSAYRKLSLLHHPDRNVGKDVAEQAQAGMLFERIQKAHEILTNPDAYQLFQTTGSPDGSRDMEVSIGLPKFLLEKKNHNLVLVVYLLILVVLVPISVGSWYSQSKLFGDRLIMNDSYNIYTYLLEKGIKLEHLPEVLALSAEFRSLPPRSAADKELLEKLSQQMKTEGKMARESFRKIAQADMFKRWPGCGRANVLIHVYLNRLTDELTPTLKEDLEFILNKSKLLIEAMNEAVSYSRLLDSVHNIVKFEQCMVQAIWGGESPLKQLPHITSEQITKAGGVQAPSIQRVISVEEEREKLCDGLDSLQKADVTAATKLLPQMEVKVTMGVIAEEKRDGTLTFEEQACEGDIMTAFVEIFREHNVGPVHAPHLPFQKNEEWFVLFTKKGQGAVLAQVKMGGPNQILRQKIQFPSKGFVRTGSHTFDFHVFSTSYIGFDQTVQGKLEVLPEGTVQPIALHQEDLDLDNELTLFEEAFGRGEPSDDSDFADTDDEDETGGSNGIANKKKTNDDDLAVTDDDGDATEAEPEDKKDK